ncbi:MAG: hypothetical protein ACFFHD_10940 [Promethearchaeota archaeon]
MNKKLVFIRFTYWYGAILDLLVFFDMIISILFEFSVTMPNVSTDKSYKYQTATGAFLMVGWTVILIWADHKPIERKDILLITAIPVVLGIMLINILYTYLWVFSAITLTVFTVAYFIARSLE